MNTRNWVLCFFLTATAAQVTAAPPKFDEVYQLLRSNLDGVTQSNLDHAALKGLLEQLPGHVVLGEGASTNSAAPIKTNIYDESYACFRITDVEDGLAGKLRAAYQELSVKSKIKGIVLDLRFAGGTNFAAAAAVADCFIDADQKLLDWGTGSASATHKTNAINLPVAILVNSETTGAAEALAAALREADIGLILGGATAGQANIFKQFTLSNGDNLSIATAQVRLGDGTALNHGLKPDIAVEESLADERADIGDPYKVLNPPASTTNDTAEAAATNDSPRRVTNEAELVREKRAGLTNDSADDNSEVIAAPIAPAPPVMSDTVLARALDLLKGIAVLQRSHPS